MSSAPAVAARVAKSQVSELIFSALPSIDSPARLSQIESMPIVSPHNNNPLADGRQSKRALLVRRGVQRLFFELGAVVLPELTLVSGRFEMAGLSAALRQVLFRDPSGCAGGHFSGGGRFHTFRRARRGNFAGSAGARTGRRDQKSAHAAIRQNGRQPPARRGTGRY